MSFAAGDESNQLDVLCGADDEKIKLFEAFVKPSKECLAELQPKFSKALSECYVGIYHTDPHTAAEAKKAFCPKNEVKMKALGVCLVGKGIKEPNPEEKKAAKKKMNECLGKKANA